MVVILLIIGGVVLIVRFIFLFGFLGEVFKFEKVWFLIFFVVVLVICYVCFIVLIWKILKEVGLRVVVFYVVVVGIIISFIVFLILNFGFKFLDCWIYDVLYVFGVGVLGYGG